MFQDMSLLKEVGIAPIGDKYKEQWKALGAWFLGPRGENSGVFVDCFKMMVSEHVHYRNSCFPADPAYITQDIKISNAFQCEIRDMKDQLMKLQEELKGSVPFFSTRYFAHMALDATMPALLGYMGAMLYNQNNVDSEASPVTTQYERIVGNQLCDMLGYNINPGNGVPLSWGHLTGGGSIANIEALWASRNLKFSPLSVRAALLNFTSNGGDKFLTEAQIQLGLCTTLLVYDNKSDMMKLIPLKDCTQWQLLNVDIDDICEITRRVTDNMATFHGSHVDVTKFMGLVDKESVVRLGLVKFVMKHDLKQCPVFTTPANNHYSWPKAGTLLGLGSDALIPVNLDKNFRQSMKHLKEILGEMLARQIPVLAVIAVMGSTEESAVDPIKDIYELREEFKNKGLNFALLADGAWGGYFKTMLIDDAGQGTQDEQEGQKSDSFMPYYNLSPFVEQQYRHLQFADTITIDPHKSGFCPYPGGALCYRNGKMRYPIALIHSAVHHGDNDPGMGVYGIEGSKPGSASAGILTSHNVIGLSNRGYGRILGQCVATTKAFYAMWLTVARDDDPFVCVPIQTVPDGWNLDDAKKMIREKIAPRTMVEVNACKEARDFLNLCGPDTIINTFVVNFKNNTDTKKTNKLQTALSDAMNIHLGSLTTERMPIILMQSTLDASKLGEGLKIFKQRLGLVENEEDLNVMVNTCMNPWQGSQTIFHMGEQFRKTVLNCLGQVEDGVVAHRFIVSLSCLGHGGDDHTLFIEYQTDSDIPEHRYQASVRVEVTCPTHKEILSDYIAHCNDEGLPVLFETICYNSCKGKVPNLYNILHSTNWDQKICVILVNEANKRKSTIQLKVTDIPRYQRLDMSSTVIYPEKQQYFVFGLGNRAIMTHVISRLPDFQHTVTLPGRPHSLTETMLRLGVEVEVPLVDGSPLFVGKEMKNPLQGTCYEVHFKGELQTSIQTTIDIEKTVAFGVVPAPKE